MATYHVFDQYSGEWLGADERTFTRRLDDATAFTHADLAFDIGAREAAKPINAARILIVMSDLGMCDPRTVDVSGGVPGEGEV